MWLSSMCLYGSHSCYLDYKTNTSSPINELQSELYNEHTSDEYEKKTRTWVRDCVTNYHLEPFSTVIHNITITIPAT